MKNIILNKFQALKKWSLKNDDEIHKISEKIEEQEQKIKDLKFNQYQKKDIKKQVGEHLDLIE